MGGGSKLRRPTKLKTAGARVSVIGCQLITRHVARRINENPFVTRGLTATGLIIIKRSAVTSKRLKGEASC